MARERDSNNSNTTAMQLLITSTDCDPKAELPFSGDTSVKWNAIIDALNHAKYCLAIRRLTLPPTRNPNSQNSPTNVAFLSLQASRKVAFLHVSGDSEEANYQISLDERLMDTLPSFCHLKGLPRFHLFTSMSEDLQYEVVRLLDGVGFARMRCVCRQFRRLSWKGTFNILRYSEVRVVEEAKKQHGNSGFLLRLCSAVLIGAVVYRLLSKIDVDEEYE